MKKVSAGLVIFRKKEGTPEVLLVHHGGPFFKNKDNGWWSIPKGEAKDGESLLETAEREVQEEIGFVPEGEFLPLGSVVQKGGKEVHAWGVSGDFDMESMHSNTVSIEWPPKTGKRIEFPEIDRGEYFDFPEAKKKIIPAQQEFLEKLQDMI